jgi:dihydrolipoamide dehydrogenase
MNKDIYDAVVIGGGAGGVPAAVRVAQLGGRVAIIEREDLGGGCMNRGCVPFGHMMAAGKILGSGRMGQMFGISFMEVLKDYSALVKARNELVAFMRLGVKSILGKNGVEVVRGKRKIIESGKVVVNGKELACRNIILATGSKWVKPGFPGANLADVINTDELLIL